MKYETLADCSPLLLFYSSYITPTHSARMESNCRRVEHS